MYEVEFSDDALADLNWFKKYDRNEILEGIDANLRHEPTVETHNRKRLHPNALAEWELRIGNFRVFYDVDRIVRIVSIEAIGYKDRNVVRFRGEKRDL